MKSGFKDVSWCNEKATTFANEHLHLQHSLASRKHPVICFVDLIVQVHVVVIGKPAVSLVQHTYISTGENPSKL